MKIRLLFVLPAFALALIAFPGCEAPNRASALISIPEQPVFTAASLPAAAPPRINAAAAVLIDVDTGRELYVRNGDQPIPPASMTKLMTIHTTLRLMENAAGDRKMTLEDAVPVSSNADFRSMPPRSSLMFIEAGQKVTLRELLQGLAIPSGNDAAVAVAEYLAGSVEAFVAAMNREAELLGLTDTRFEDASGLSEHNLTTTRDYARFCRIYIAEHAEILPALHLPETFTYPKTHNLPPSGKSVYGPITQPNHNILIDRLDGVFGLKTGYIDESGYNFAAACERDGRRLILVTLGGPGESAYDGALRRALDAAVLFEYGFQAWILAAPRMPVDIRFPVGGGAARSLAVSYSPAAPLQAETAALAGLRIQTVGAVVAAPVNTGDTVGVWHLLDSGGEVLQSGTVFAAESVARGNLFQRLRERLGLQR